LVKSDLRTAYLWMRRIQAIADRGRLSDQAFATGIVLCDDQRWSNQAVAKGRVEAFLERLLAKQTSGEGFE
jgi:hypothetical protein